MAINGQALPSAVSFESPNVLVAYVWHAIACYVIALYIRCRTEPEQSVAFELERICYLDVCVEHAVSGAPIPGCKLKAYDVSSQRVASNSITKGVRDSSSSPPRTSKRSTKVVKDSSSSTSKAKHETTALCQCGCLVYAMNHGQRHHQAPEGTATVNGQRLFSSLHAMWYQFCLLWAAPVMEGLRLMCSGDRSKTLIFILINCTDASAAFFYITACYLQSSFLQQSKVKHFTD
eukprot:1159940-Pelagomonas_calceolata.AAC.10